ETQKETYEYFYNINEEIKTFLSTETKSNITNWDVEHCFWNIHLDSIKQEKSETEVAKPKEQETEEKQEVKNLIKANFDINDYLIPKVANLLELGADTSKSSSQKGSLFEKKVAEIFKLLDFDVKTYGQGTGRNPDAILTFREENTAFIVDAKAYAESYNLGLDDRAIREHINHYCPKLIKDGYKKIGFIIVSNSFKSDFEAFINDVTWNTEVKRFVLLTSSALLHLLAYKTKDNVSVNQIIDSLIKLGTLITEKQVIGEFEDV
ncbi:MAG: restriction endonuclease FokI C-terminal domain-containing protein, partial [Tenacibaculum sp.]